MDSIKAGDIIATAARKLGALGPIDPASLADATIGDVVRAITAAQNGEAAPTTPNLSTNVAPQASAPMALPQVLAPTSMPASPTPAMNQPRRLVR